MHYFYFTDTIGGHLLTFSEDDRWCLGTDYDRMGNAYIYLILGVNDCPICNSRELTVKYPKLRAKNVNEYYTAVLKAIFEHVRGNGSNFVNVDTFRRDVLARYWPVWREAGYVDGDIPAIGGDINA